MNTNAGFRTLCIHAGEEAAGADRGALPIYQTSSFSFADTQAADAGFASEDWERVYSRYGNPTVAVFEGRMAALEGGEAGLAFASGMAAILAAVLSFGRAGEEIVSSRQVYGGTYHLFQETLPRFGISTRWVDPDPEQMAHAITEQTRLVFFETPGNPTLSIVDIAAAAHVTKAAGVPLVVDNTFATPYLQQPIVLGADVVVHSATKYLGGHGTSLGGVLIGRREWCMRVRKEIAVDLGGSLSPFNAWLFCLGLETLPLRMEAHCQNAERIARRLAEDKRVAWVAYPGLAGHPGHEIAAHQMRGFGGIVCFAPQGGREAAVRMMDSLKLCAIQPTLGDTRTMALHPASTSHRQLSPEQLEAVGIREDMVRLSVGLEDAEDIIADLDAALKKA